MGDGGLARGGGGDIMRRRLLAPDHYKTRYTATAVVRIILYVLIYQYRLCTKWISFGGCRNIEVFILLVLDFEVQAVKDTKNERQTRYECRALFVFFFQSPHRYIHTFWSITFKVYGSFIP